MEIIGVGSVRAPVARLLEHFLGFGRHPRLALRHSTLRRSGPHTQFTDQLCEMKTSCFAATWAQPLTCCWGYLAGCWGGRSGLDLPGLQCPLPQGAAPCAQTLKALGSVWDTRHGLQAGIRHTQGRSQDTNAGCTRSMLPHGGAISKHMAHGLQAKTPWSTKNLGFEHTEQLFSGRLTSVFIYDN